jgi:hypothetical protein
VRGVGFRCDGGCGDDVSRIALSPIAMGESPPEGRPRYMMGIGIGYREGYGGGRVCASCSCSSASATSDRE